MIRRYLLAYLFAGASAVLASGYGFMSAVGFFAFAKAGILALVSFGATHGPAWGHLLYQRRQWLGVIVAAIATPACLLVTLWGGLGTISAGGSELRAERTKNVEDVSRDRTTLKRLEAERQAITARPTDAVSAELKTARAHPLFTQSEGCESPSGPKSRAHCESLRKLETELANAKEAAELEARIGVLNGKLDNARPPVDADPQASAVSALTGLSVPFSMALYALLASIACELIGMLAMLVAWSEPKPVAVETTGPTLSTNREPVALSPHPKVREPLVF